MRNIHKHRIVIGRCAGFPRYRYDCSWQLAISIKRPRACLWNVNKHRVTIPYSHNYLLCSSWSVTLFPRKDDYIYSRSSLLFFRLCFFIAPAWSCKFFILVFRTSFNLLFLGQFNIHLLMRIQRRWILEIEISIFGLKAVYRYFWDIANCHREREKMK